MNHEGKAIKRSHSTYYKLEEIVGCKWSVSVLLGVAQGVNRPGALERHIEGISAKVLAERLRKLTAYGLLSKHCYPELPPRTEYALTAAGDKLVAILRQLQELDVELGEQAGAER
ncbi:HxlR family transcriptional regulator [Stutzerimonas stutzeri TS44]|nr:HxlR family transcriptional regulator [Stutzerimonas stutzeri TS44]